jgi:adenine-specific DNA methylase
MLRHAPKVGSLRSELNMWSEKINNTAENSLKEYFPSTNNRKKPSHYVCTYTVSCPDCDAEIPLVKQWWLDKDSSTEGVAARPQMSESGELNYNCVTLPEEIGKSEFNPQDGPKSRNGVECLRCGIVMENEVMKENLRQNKFKYDIIGVKFTTESSGSGWRAPTEDDEKAIKKASDKVESDFELQSLLSVKRYDGDIHERSIPYGVEEWRDAFTPRQLLTHYEYLSALEEHKPQIKSKYSDEKAEAIITLLSLASSKIVGRNCRFTPLDRARGDPANALGGKQFKLQWTFIDNNLTGGIQSYETAITRVRNSYEEIVGYLDNQDPNNAEISQGDAAQLDIDDSSVQAVIIDPPYYDSIIYSEMSDMSYVWLREYLSDIYPDTFSSDLTDKDREAVANVAEYNEVATASKSKSELAAEDYENKMAGIFQELYRVLESGGVMTVMFTHKESSAWDTLTKSLIRSGFTITSTHPITSEMPQRTDTRGGGSADSTLLLTGRKPHESKTESETLPTLWSDVRAETREVAKEAARDLLDSGLSLTKTDVIISAFGPTLKVYADAYPVVDEQDNEVPPRRALEEAREAVTRVLVEEYLEGERLYDLDDITEWYILSWLVHGSDTFHYDDGHQLGLGIGVDIDDIKRSTKTWGKKRGDIQLKTHEDRVQDITLPPEERSNRTPVDPEALSYTIALDAVHAAMHVYEKQGEDIAIDWLKERNFDTDAGFKATLKALLQVLPQNSSEWEAARDLALGRTHDALGLEFTPTDFTEPSEDTLEQSELGDHT